MVYSEHLLFLTGTGREDERVLETSAPARFSATSDLAMAKDIRALCAADQTFNGTVGGRASVLIGG